MMKRTARLALLYTLEAVAALIALAIFAVAVMLWRLASGPVPLDMLKPDVTRLLSEAFEAERAEIGTLTVSYDPELAALVLTASDVRVYEADGEVLTAARRIEAGFALDLLLIGRTAPVRFAADGGTFAVVRRADGTLAAGLGRPERVSQGPGAGSGGLSERLSGFAGGTQADALSRLVQVDLRGADIRLVDDVTETTLLFQGARAEIDLSEEAIDADFSGTLLGAAGETPIALGLVTGRDLQTFFLDLRIRDLRPAGIAPQRGQAAMLAALDAPIDLDIVVDASRETGLNSALVDLDLGAGQWRGEQGVFAIEGGEVRLAYDTAAGRIEIDALRLVSDIARLDLSGEIFDLSGYEDALPSRAQYRLSSGPGLIETFGAFPEPIRWEAVEAEGDLDRQDVAIGFDRLAVTLDVARGEFAGRVALRQIDGRILPDAALEGPITGTIGKTDVLRFWPVNFALGARDWIRDSVLAGELSDAYLDMHLEADDIAEKDIENEDLSLRFHFADAAVRYVSTMTPLTGLSGHAELLGNALTLDGEGGRIGELDAETIFVRIGRLHPKGAIAWFGGTGTGEASDLIALIDEEPLGFATDYGIDPQSFEGEGTIRFEIGRPMLRDVPVEDIAFDIEANFADVAGPAGVGDLRFTDGVVTIVADAQGLVGTGEAELAGTRADIRWEEDFQAGEGANSTLIAFATRADETTLDRLGLPLRRFLDGMVGVEARLAGQGFDFRAVELSLDMADAAIALPADIWGKAPGEPAAAALSMRFGEDGVIILDTLSASAPTARISASARFAADGRLLDAEASEVFIEDLMDVSVEAARPEGPDGRLHVRLSGASLNARDLFDELRAMAGGPDTQASDAPTLPLVFEAAVDQVNVRDVEFSDVQLSLATQTQGVERFLLAGRTAAGPVDLRFAPAGDGSGRRILTAESADAGALLTAFAGFDNARGGALVMSGEAPPLGEAGPLTGAVDVGAFTLERMPLLARILAAGSLEGLGSLLSGQGLVFERLETQFSWDEGLLQTSEARVAGPALGITWSGLVDFEAQRLALDGTLLPSYGMNSVLGELPVVGELFTSRRGEGVIGVTFSVQGPFDATQVTANPLSALAPGVFRRIFEGTSAERELEALERRRREAQDAAVPAEPQTPDEPGEPQENP